MSAMDGLDLTDPGVRRSMERYLYGALGRGSPLVEDSIQASLAYYLKRPPAPDCPNPVGGLCRKALWIALTTMRGARRERRWWELVRAPALAQPGDSDPYEQEQVQAALQRIRPEYARALVLRHVAEMSYQEIAEAMGTNAGRARWYLRLGREAFVRAWRQGDAYRPGHTIAQRDPETGRICPKSAP